MIAGVEGRLISSTFVREILPTLTGFCRVPSDAARMFARTAQRASNALGPATPVRTIADAIVIPLMRVLGYDVAERIDEPARCFLSLRRGPPEGGHYEGGHHRGGHHEDGNSESAHHLLAVLVVTWNAPLSSAGRGAIHGGISADVRWALCCNGSSIRIVDAQRTWSRDYLEFGLDALGDSDDAQSLLWSLVRAEAVSATPPLLDRAVGESVRHGLVVCRALGDGVLDALRLLVSALAPRSRGRHEPDVLFEHSLTVVYRLLFLLFAEARGLVPLWHPVYRDRYSLGTIVDALVADRAPPGVWRAVQAISRLAHTGCSAGTLSVTAFNGRLFSPTNASAFDQGRVDDGIVGRAVVAVSTMAMARSGRRARVAFRDLDVEQLGAVYERVLDYQPARSGGSVALARTGDVRKSTGTFYTPRSMTSYLVRRTLEPLVAGRSAEDILNLRVLDPAMGSGAFLVSACRYLAAAAEQALVQDGEWQAHDVTTADRTLLRRQIASRCLFGVDLNPMAVQLARLSLWLATLSANKPLSFLDHHLIAGNSLTGASPADVQRQPPGKGRRRRSSDAPPLFSEADLAPTLADGVAVRRRLTSEADESAAIVRAKEQSLAELTRPAAPISRWCRLLDLWCAAWFWEHGTPPDHRSFADLSNHILGTPHQLPARFAAPILEQAATVARRHRFLHWPLAFPEVFANTNGDPLPNGGFDAVIGNPPWDMVRGDSGDEETRADRRAEARQLASFVRESGIYASDPRGHANRYQLFVERALQLVRRGGRVGLVLPSGVASDAGAATLRRFLFDRACIDEITGLDNRDAIFPIHRSTRFVLLTCSAGTPTADIRCRFGISTTDALERADDGDRSVETLSRGLHERLSGPDDLGIPDVGGAIDLRLLERISSRFPRIGDRGGWHAQFGRELNATDDRGDFEPYVAGDTARPVVEGKQIEPFRVCVGRSRYQLAPEAPARIPRRTRLAYRDVASATNRLTLIAAMIPSRAVTTHTLFCLKTPLPLDSQQVLCGLLNSYVANYLVRFRVNTHVTVSLVSRLPVPFIAAGDPVFDRILALVRALLQTRESAEEMDEYAQLQALIARLYGLSSSELEHVLSTFPLVSDDIKRGTRDCFRRLTT